ncbi:MAG: 30S ribosomal protein S5 [Mycoplasma sp.]|nr:30S ribosomal protein S5 [Mycoplasma sp.]
MTKLKEEEKVIANEPHKNTKTIETKKIDKEEQKSTTKKEITKTSKPQGSQRNGNSRGGRRNGGRFNNRRQTEFEERVVNIARVTTVVKGGRRFSFSALVVIGNKKGKVGWGHGKANEVPDAIKKAIKDARNNMIIAPIIDKRTVPHEQIGNFLASSILVKPAPKGKGIIASGAIRTVVELAGYTDIYTKSLGSRSKTNSVKAAIEALKQLRTIEEIAKLRDIKVEYIKG